MLSDATPLEDDWLRDGDVGMMLSGAAGDLASAAAAVGPTSVADSETALTAAADALEDAGVAIETAGCGCGGDGGDVAVWEHLSQAGAALRVAAGEDVEKEDWVADDGIWLFERIVSTVCLFLQITTRF